ncbi:condensation domain-containing protein [Pedobacter sp. L105]|uniref:phthiocerol/phthiodiolone dimycocerosyl transferase family protein n=1 Tax=Pedobacter sp. L105 TaxID=1641871 RepID=UPI00131D9DAC|nr:condensation domain-containing protein [Pedobacter sp. L105]
MKRKMIIGERLMYIDSSTPLNCVFTVKLKGDLSAERLGNALAKIQQKHPLLRTSIKEDEKGIPFFVSGNAISEIPVRVVERYGDEDWKVHSKMEWVKLFDQKHQPLARVVWLKGKGVSELLLICPHCVCDGTTMVALMSELLLLLDHPEKELMAYPPFNSIDELISQTYSGNLKKIVKARLFSVFARLFFLLKSTKNDFPPGNSYLLQWKLDAEKTAGLVAASKASGATVHTVLCAVFLEAFQYVKGEKAHGKVICPVDIRKFVPEIKDDMMFAFAPIAELSVGKDKNVSYLKKAVKLKEELHTKIAAINAQELLLMGEYFHSSVDSMIKHLRSTNGSHDVTLSNMGKMCIAEQYDSFEVETIYSPTVAFPWRNPTTLIVSTFKGEMDFAFCSNSAFLDSQEACAIKDKALELLWKN